MRRTHRTAGPFAVIVLVTLAGCFSLSRDTPTLQQYVIGGVRAPEPADAPPDTAGLTIGLRRLDLAPYLATPAIVVRRGAHRIVHSEFHRWGEDPVIGISRAIAGYLADAAAIRAVDVAPWPVRSRYDYLIQLHVTRFEGVAPADSAATEGEAHMLAAWEIVRQQDETVLARGTTDHREGGWRVSDYGALVALLDRGVQTLARDIATCLDRLASSTRAAADHALACAPQTD